MDDAFAMKVGEASEYLLCVYSGQMFREGIEVLQEVAECAFLHIFHHQIQPLRRFNVAIEFHYMRMA